VTKPNRFICAPVSNIAPRALALKKRDDTDVDADG
jgi:hypothetical protein